MAHRSIGDRIVVAAALEARHGTYRHLLATLAAWTGQPGGVCHRAAQRATRRGLIRANAPTVRGMQLALSPSRVPLLRLRWRHLRRTIARDPHHQPHDPWLA